VAEHALHHRPEKWSFLSLAQSTRVNMFHFNDNGEKLGVKESVGRDLVLEDWGQSVVYPERGGHRLTHSRNVDYFHTGPMAGRGQQKVNAGTMAAPTSLTSQMFIQLNNPH
jgi:hypothetical protein